MQNQDWMPARVYRATTGILGNWRGLFLPFGIAALVAMGVHLASDVLVDGVFIALNAFDRVAESIVSVLLGALEATGLPDEGWAARNSYAFAALVEIETREIWARYGGVVVELLVDLFLVRAALGWDEPIPRFRTGDSTRPGIRGLIDTTRIRATRIRRELHDYLRDITVEKIYLPIASLCAIIAGCYSIGLALENLFYSWLAPLPGTTALSFWFATLPSAAITCLLAWRLGWRMLLHSFSYAEAQNERMIFDGTRLRKRRLHGLVPAIFILPIMLVALFVGTPVGRLWGVG